jgi:hypothetical protein
MFNITDYNNINLTKEGLIIKYGVVLQKNIKVDLIVKDSTLKLSFYDKLGIFNVSKMSITKFSFLHDTNNGDVIGILPLDGEWYLCWNPKIKRDSI